MSDSDSTRSGATIPADRFVTAGSVRLRYWREGSGERVVLLLHGLNSFAEEWLPILSALSERYRVYVLDLPGHGGSDAPDADYTPEYYAEAAHAFLRSQGIDRAFLVGRSLGGGVCLELALRHPELCERLVLLAPAGLGRSVARALRLMSLPGIGERVLHKQSSEEPRPPRRHEGVPEEIEERINRAREERRGRPSSGRVLLSTLRASITLLGLRSHLRKRSRKHAGDIRVPVLLIWGERDGVVPPAHGRRAARRMPNARIEVLADCGHNLALDQPVTVRRLILDFLA